MLSLAILLVGVIIGYLLARLRYKRVLDSLNHRLLFWKEKCQNFQGISPPRNAVVLNQPKKTIQRINALIRFGENIKKNTNVMKNPSVQISESMKELKSDTIAFLTALLGEGNPLHQKAVTPPSVKPSSNPKTLYASKVEFVDHYISLLEVLKAEIRG